MNQELHVIRFAEKKLLVGAVVTLHASEPEGTQAMLEIKCIEQAEGLYTLPGMEGTKRILAKWFGDILRSHHVAGRRVILGPVALAYAKRVQQETGGFWINAP